MRAVNLIPEDLRRGSTAAGRTGSSVYVLLGALSLLVVLVSAWALTGRQVSERRGELARTQAEAQAAEARAGVLAPYAKFAELREKRVQTVTSLSRSRFNWSYALREVSRVLPEDVWLTTVFGSVAPGVTVEGGGSGTTSTLRSAISAPALEIAGCTLDQANVARYLARLRSVDGVTRVTLSSSEKLVSSSGSSAGSSPSTGPNTGADCRQSNESVPKFELVVFFERSTATASRAGAPGTAAPVAAPAASPSTPASTGSTK